MFESAYEIENKRIFYCLKLACFLITIVFLFTYFYKYPKTFYYEGLTIEKDGDIYLRVLSQDAQKFTNDYMKLIIDEKYYDYEVAFVDVIDINNRIYYYVNLKIDKEIAKNTNVKMNIYLGQTTIFKEIKKNLKKGITYGQTK